MMAGDKHCACRVHCKSVHANTSPGALTEVVSTLASPAILGGNPAKVYEDGFSYWAAEPRDMFVFETGQSDPLARLQETLDRYTLTNDSFVRHNRDDIQADTSTSPDGMFTGGWIGHFSYELGRHIERLPGAAVDDLQIPRIRLCFYDRVIAYDHRRDVFWITALELPGDRESPEEKIAAVERWLRQSQQTEPAALPAVDIENIDVDQVRRNMTQDAYLDAVRRIKRHIHDGDIYQANFSHRFEHPFQGTAARLFHWQNCHNPSGYAAYLDARDFQIVSASPEMFIAIQDGRIRTKPIKGTRPRINACDEQASKLNAQRFQELLTSEKEQAELNMIIDLERNDVARICKPGTRRVIQPRTIERYPSVFHAVATVGGELRDDVTFSDVLKAMFPGGSITGAPKIRAMEIIDELEPTARGIYTGAIGFIGLDGTVCLNIAIRTAIITNGSAFVQTGGGIVADSDPQAEWAETITKARALLAGIRAVEDTGR
ncbi:MAG: anthranilate synthase component I family protein [Sedimentisphaerales bacterium]|nr:anthranilate synthase component I family protein [Sedimentisphaerales bacterium]